MPFDTTATLFLLVLLAGMLAASLSRALLYLSGSMTTPGVFRILGRVRFLGRSTACSGVPAKTRGASQI